MSELILKNASVVLADEVIRGSVYIKNGIIDDITTSDVKRGIDFEGDYLIPGLIELHTDHLEGHYMPRPKVRWNPVTAVQAHDAQIAAAGITTVFDALRIGMDTDADLTANDMKILSAAIAQSKKEGRLRADHMLHLRCEVSADDCLEAFAHFEGDDLVKVASLMDHAPGQRQFVNLETYKFYYMRMLKCTEEEFQAYSAERIAQSERNSAKHRRAISAYCRENNIALASHDDATEAHVDEAKLDGVKIAEFPTTFEAAIASHKENMHVLMGAPNIVRGGSHSGNISAQELAEQGYLDIISSDYIPASLMQSVFHLADQVDTISLPQSLAMVTLNPARAAGLDDRGEIAIGKRADIVRVKTVDNVPIIRKVWREGVRVM